MLLQDIASLGKMLAQFLALFASCFHGSKGRRLLAVYVGGLLSDLQRKNAESIALKQGVAPRTLQRFLESIKWDHDGVLRRCQGLIAQDHCDRHAIGVIDETGTAKSGNHTVGVKRQYNGNRGKIENSVVVVAASYATKTFSSLMAARMYLPEDWASDPLRRKKLHSRRRQVSYQTTDRVTANR
jgi:SRSO17 transposase